MIGFLTGLSKQGSYPLSIFVHRNVKTLKRKSPRNNPTTASFLLYPHYCSASHSIAGAPNRLGYMIIGVGMNDQC